MTVDKVLALSKANCFSGNSDGPIPVILRKTV